MYGRLMEVLINVVDGTANELPAEISPNLLVCAAAAHGDHLLLEVGEVRCKLSCGLVFTW